MHDNTDSRVTHSLSTAVSSARPDLIRTAETLTLFATLVAFAVTIGALESGIATEANPVAESLFAMLGYHGTAVAAFVGLVTAYRLLAKAKTIAPITAAAGAMAIALVSIGDAGWNIYLVVGRDSEQALTPSILGGAVGLFALLAAVWVLRRPLSELARTVGAAVPISGEQSRALVFTFVMVSSVAAMPLLGGLGGMAAASTGAEGPLTADTMVSHSLAAQTDTVENATVYVGSYDNNLYAIDAVTGEQKWSYTTGSAVDSSPTVANGTVYVGSYDNNLYAIDAATGEEQWSYPTSDYIVSSPTITDGTVYVGSTDNNLYAIDAETGEKQWNYSTGGGIQDSSPTVADGTVYVGSYDNNLYAIDAATGEEQWNHSTAGRIDSSPSVADDTVYVGSYDNNLYAIDTATGEEQWNYSTGNKIESSPTVTNGAVYIGSNDNSSYAIDATTGEEQWSYTTGDSVVSSPTVANGTVYVGSHDNNLYAIDAETGKEQWNHPTGDRIWSSPTVGGDAVYIGSDSTNLHAVSISTGEELWNYSAGDTLDSSPTYVSAGSGYSNGSRVNLRTLGHHGQTSSSVNSVSGQVTTCPLNNPTCKNPTPAPNGTIVEAVGVVPPNLEPEQGQTLKERAEEIRSEIEDVDYDSFNYDPDLDVESTISDGKAPVVNTEGDWAGSAGTLRYTDNPYLGTPRLQAPADERFYIHLREPSGNRIQDNADEDLAGVTTSGTIVIEQLSYDSDVVDTRKVDTTDQVCLGVSVGKKCHEAAGVSLSPGFYRIYPEGQPANGYPISVGEPQQQIRTITSDLETEANQLTKRGERIVDLATKEKIVRKTTATYTDENGTAGKFNLSVPKDVNTLQVQAYTPAAEGVKIDDVQNASFEDLQTLANLETYNESFYITPAPESVDVPANETSIRAVEVNSIPFQDIGKSMNKSEWLRSLLENETYADIASDYLEPTEDMNSTEIEDLHSELSDLADENENLRDRLSDRQDIDVTLDPDQNTDELKAEIEALRQEITQLEGGLNTGDPETDIGDGTVDATIPFDGDLAPDGASVVANNVQTGETTVVDEQYWSVNKQAGQPDQLVIEDYPIDADTAQIAFGITASSEDGQDIADTQVPITNPAFSGNALSLQAIDVTTVMPGPSESVTVEPTVGSDSVGIESVNATVQGPDGERPTTNPAADEVRFETNGAGSYQIQLTITDANGQQWSETVSIQAIEETVSQDPSVRAVDGFTGPLALAGDGLEGGSVDTSGSELEVSAISPRDNVPSSLHVYAEGISNNHQDITVNLLKATGEGEPEQARRNAKVFVHVTELPDSTVAFREGNQPLGIGEDTAYGGAHPSDRGDAHVIKTHTSDDGSVTIEVQKDPGFLTSAFYDIQTTVPFLLPRPSALSPLSTAASALLPILEVVIDLAATTTSLVVDPATAVTFDAPVADLAAAHGGATPA